MTVKQETGNGRPLQVHAIKLSYFITTRHKGTKPKKLTAAKLQECRDNADAEDQLDPGEARSSGPRNRVGLKKSSFQRYLMVH